ncbi:MAG: monovalent cation/H(+) antiporter subunit G [Gemmobacter sp.]
MLDWIAALFLLAGAGFCLVAGIGILRMPDVFSRMHAATKAGTMGLLLICIAMMIKAERPVELIEPLFVVLFMLATAPVAAHLLGRAALHTRVPLDPATTADKGAEAFASAPERKHG